MIQRFRYWGFAAAVVITTGVLPAASRGGDDWPTYLHDRARSGVSSAHIKPPLVKVWTLQSAQPPRSAWEKPRAVAEGIRERHRVASTKCSSP